MEAWLITAVKELASCLISLWRKLAYDLAEDMLVPSEPNNRNMSAVKMAYRLNVRCDLCLWNEESKIVLQSCPLVLRTAFSLEGFRCAEELTQVHTDTHKYRHSQRYTRTHTHRHTDTHAQTQWHTNIDTHTHKAPQAYTHTDTDTQASMVARTRTHTFIHSLTHTHTLKHTHTLPTHIDHHTAEFLKAMSPLCDGIQCRLTARTAGSTEGEILAESWKRSKETE